MRTQTNNSVQLKWFKAGCTLLLTVSALLFAWATPIFAAEDPATPLEVTTTLRTNQVTLAWTSPEDVAYTLYRSTTGAWEDAVAVDTPLLALLDVNSSVISYSFVDSVDASAAKVNYWIVKTVGDNQTVNYGPYAVQLGTKLFLPQIVR
jgi:hypothetical protein